MRSPSWGPIIRYVVIVILIVSYPSRSIAAAPSITLATDKTKYAWGEIIKLEVVNSQDISIWYIAYPQSDLAFWEIEKAQDKGWKRLEFRLPLIEGSKEDCQIILYERPIGIVTELKPYSNLFYKWNQKICPHKTVTGLFEPEMVGRGRYRFAFRYSLDVVKPEKIELEPWKRPIDLGATKVIYSNEFVLE